MIACNSATSAGLEVAQEIAGEQGVEVVAVIEPEAEVAAAISELGRVGVLATPATVESGAYLRALADQHRELTVTEVEAPDLAAVIQRGFPFDEAVVEMVRCYCSPLKRAGVDTVILGCTHYPLVAPMLQRILGREVRLVTAGHAIAATVQRRLEEGGLETDRRGRRAPTASSAPRTPTASGSWAPGSCRCRSARSSWWRWMAEPARLATWDRGYP